MKTFNILKILFLMAAVFVFNTKSAVIKATDNELENEDMEGAASVMEAIEEAIEEEREELEKYKEENPDSEGPDPAGSEALEEIKDLLNEDGVDKAEVLKELEEVEDSDVDLDLDSGSEIVNDDASESNEEAPVITSPSPEESFDEGVDENYEVTTDSGVIGVTDDSFIENTSDVEITPVGNTEGDIEEDLEEFQFGVEEIIGDTSTETPPEDNSGGLSDEIVTEIGTTLSPEDASDEFVTGEIDSEVGTETTTQAYDGTTQYFDKTSQDFDDTMEMDEPISRKKRNLVRKGHRWPKAVVPYHLDKKIVPSSWIPSIIRAMGVFSRFTCLNFVPYKTDGESQTVNEKMSLGHGGYLNFINSDSCYSVLGYIGSAQEISCCKGKTCLHELGHSMGAYHEQQNPEGKPYVRINMANIQTKFKFAYEYKKGFNTGYDVQSIMHYNPWTWASGGRTMDMRVSTGRGITEGDYYHLLQEISLAHNCQDQCQNHPVKCENDGYLTPVDGICQCRCPIGLDPSTGCTTVMKKGFNSRPWPKGKYALPMPESGCPTAQTIFKEGSRSLNTDKAICENTKPGWHCKHWRDTGYCKKSWGFMSNNCPNYCGLCDDEKQISWWGYSLKGSVANGKLSESYCVSDGSQNTMEGMSEEEYTKVKWAAGSYCIIRKGGACPDGFLPGSITLTLNTDLDNTKSGVDIDGEFTDKKSTQMYCCRNDGYASDPLDLPATKTFSLYAYSGSCQKVKGMIEWQEYKIVKITNETTDVVGETPIGREHPGRGQYKISHCIYKPADMDCGGVIELSAETTEKTISFATANNYTRCNWLVKGPVGSRIVLTFQTFQLNTKSDAKSKCSDTMSLRIDRLGQSPVVYCGDRLDTPFTTFYNTLFMTLQTREDDKETKFEAKVKLLFEGNSCYKMSNKGVTYNGKHNYTISNKPCIPWTKATKCSHHAFNSGDYNANLVSNFCRNPEKTGMGPWCYTDADSCASDVCDVCQMEPKYDSKACNASSCETSDVGALLQCAKTCQDKLPKIETPKHGKCGKPGDIQDGVPVGDLKDEYEDGETVVYRCKTSALTEHRTCLSDGTWSHLDVICVICREDWTYANGKCYAFLPDDGKGNIYHARWVCGKYNATVVTVGNPEEQAIVEKISREYEVWLGLNDEEEEGKWVWNNGSLVDWSSWGNWMRGQPNNYRGREDCAVMRRRYSDWKDVNCSALKTRITCEHKAWGERNCGDKVSYCADVKTSQPDVCSKQESFMKNFCPKTCGKC